MAERRWQIVVGAVVLVLLLLAAAFSLGVFVGEHGWTREALRYQPGPAAGPQGDALPAVLSERPDVVGRVRALTLRTLDLATQAGPRQVELTAETQFEDEQGSALAPGDLRRGDIVAVFGEALAGDGIQLQAIRVVRLPQQAPSPP